MEETTDDICQFHERPVSPRGTSRFYPPDVRCYEECPPAPVSDIDQAVKKIAEIKSQIGLVG
jgi:hypothetical protein